MKNTNLPASKNKTAPHRDAKKPEIRDNLDSRKNEEFEMKGDDVTHNKKETKKEKVKSKK